MPKTINELLVAQGGLRVPASAALGKIAVSDGSGNVSWQSLASLLPSSVEMRASGEVTPEQYGAKGDGVLLFNATMTAGSAVLNSTDSGVNFTSADVGKTIIVSGVAAGNDALVTTILSVQTSSQVTLAASATNASPDPAGLRIAAYGTDDTAAIQAASDAAAQANSGCGGTVKFDSKIYLAAGALVQGGARKCNAQITLPNGGVGKGNIGRLVWKGARDFSGSSGASPFPNLGGTVVLSTLVSQSYSATYGVPSIVGGPTREQQSGFNGWLHSIEDIGFLAPRNPSISGLNHELCSAINRRRVSVGTLEWGFFQTGQESATFEPSHPAAAAFIDPMQGNFQAGAGRSDQIATWGYVVGIVPSEHTYVTSLLANQTLIPIGVRSAFWHAAKINNIASQRNPYLISGWDPTQATVAASIVAVPSSGSLSTPICVDAADIEDFSDTSMGNLAWSVVVNHINDPNNKLRGYLRFHRLRYLSGAFGPAPGLIRNGGNGMLVQPITSQPDNALLGRAISNPTANAQQYVLSTVNAWTAIDAANLSITFTAPYSGDVVVELDCLAFPAGTTPYKLWLGCVDTSGSYVTDTASQLLGSDTVVVVRRYRHRRIVTGLTPGQSYTWRAAWLITTTGQTMTINYGGQGVTGNASTPSGPVTFEIRAIGDADLQD